MSTTEVRDSDEARRFLLQGLWLQRVRPSTRATVRDALEWSLAVVSGGEPLPPIGFLADLGTLAFALDREERADRGNLAVPGLSAAVARAYEDYVLGKLYADWTFERAGDALRRYQGRDRGRGLAFVINQFRARAAFDGVHLSPAVIRAALERPQEEVLAQGWESLRGGLMPLLAQLYESLIASTRSTAEILGPEDVFDLFVMENDSAPLAQEEELLRMLLGERIANGTVRLERVNANQLLQRCAQAARRSLCHGLAISCGDRPMQSDAATVTRLRLAGPWPEIGYGADTLTKPEAEDPISGWSATLGQLLRLWV
jgi:hypothetical protein